jgi:heavy metal sensor kinase
MTFDSIRGRLTAWYTSVLAVLLVAAGLASYGVMRRQMRHSTDVSLMTGLHQLHEALSGEAAENDGVLTVRSAAEVLNELRDSDREMTVFTFDGRELAASAVPAALAVDPRILQEHVRRHAFGLSMLEGAHAYRLLLAPMHIGTSNYVVALAQSLDGQEELLASLRYAMAVTIPLALLVAAMGGYLLARKSLAPVAAMSAQARAVGASNLGERIAVTNPRDELGQLAATLNALLARLEESFASQRRFMADASHELRSPVAILQGELDVTLAREDREAREYRESLEIMRKTVIRLTRIVRDLFLLARGDAGQVPLRHERFYLDDVVVQTVQGFRTLAAEQGVTLREEHEPDMAMHGDPDLIGRLAANLVENAIKNTPAGGEVSVLCAANDGQLRIEVHDRGRGIPVESQERIFERFFRLDPSHSPTNGAGGSGAGLGLPIARWIAEVHGGKVWVAKSDASGSVFVAALPGSEAG